jgi:D-3-phosphoglycerate dehydrogenase / 2-oxoglutarate reductase
LADLAGESLTVAISVSSFGAADPAPRTLLAGAGARLVENPHGRTLTETEVVELLRDADGLIAGTEPLTAQVLEGAGRLRAISRVGVGTDNVDLAAAARLGIAVFNTPAAVTQAAAELTLGGILSVLRHIHWMDRELRDGRWTRKMGTLLSGKTVGIVGLGRIGKRVAGLLEPFGVERIGYDIFPDTTWAHEHHVAIIPFHDLLERAHVVTIHTSKTPDVGPIFGRAELARMRPGAVIVDTARGDVLDEDALADAIREGRLAGAYLDVFAKEPYDGPLRELDNVLLTPHAGSYAEEARLRMETEAVEQLLAFLVGETA